MPRSDGVGVLQGAAVWKAWLLCVGGLALVSLGAPGHAAELQQRYRAPIVVQQPGPYVRLPLGIDVYAKSAPDAHGGLADLRVVDARGERVPFALLGPRADEQQAGETWLDARPFRLPPRAASGEQGLPLELSVESGRITVRPGAAGVRGTPGGGDAAARSPGWLFDLGEREKTAAAPRTLRVRWSGPAEFSASFALEHSADLKQWRTAGTGQLVALSSGGAALSQPDVALPADVGRFVRLVWTGEGPFPQIDAARAATPTARPVVLDGPQVISIAPSAEPAGTHADAASARALHFDLGAVLTMVRLELQLPGTRVLPALVEVRERADARWEPLAATVFYRLERDGAVAVSPPITMARRVRYVRMVGDERAGTPAAAGVQLQAHVHLGSLVFAAQGQPPYALLAGAAKADIGALPLATLVPDLEQERPRFGRAALGAWEEVAEAAKRAEADALKARARPWLLWALILGGVAGLGFMVWRLMRGRLAA